MSKQNPSFSSAFTMWEILLLVSLFGILCWIAIPNFNHPRSDPSTGCINNLRQIAGAAAQFALENHKTNGEALNFPDDLKPYIRLTRKGEIPPCPSGGIYTLKRVGDTPTCSIGTNAPFPHVFR
jgi:type II secretory pathway pseudopilin PulG